jgi:predicted nucleic acid-binding protein
MIYMLSTQSLLDLLGGNPGITKWLSSVPVQQVEISAVSVGQAIDTIQQSANAANRNYFQRQLDRIVVTVKSSDGLIPFDEGAARMWAELQSMKLDYKMRDGSNTELSAESRMVVATARDRGATFVEDSQPYHAAIPDLQIVSP